MKKHLMALAALMALSGAAFAQSSVTLYGVADVGFGKVYKQKAGMISRTVLNNSNSYIGFRGIEDLGGGLKVGFQFEQQIDIATGNTLSAQSGNKLSDYYRGANVWIEGGFGQFKMGQSVTPSYNALAAWSILDMANYSTVHLQYGYAGEDARNSSQFVYKTPYLGGFSAEVALITKGDHGNNAKYDLNLIYADGPISAGIAYNKTQKQKANFALGGKYDFGGFALSAGYYNVRHTPLSYAPAGSVPKFAGYSIGGSVGFDNISLAIELQRQQKNEYTLSGRTYKYKKYTDGTLAAKYALSKRTFFYADYIRFEGTNSYGIGMQHKF